VKNRLDVYPQDVSLVVYIEKNLNLPKGQYELHRILKADMEPYRLAMSVMNMLRRHPIITMP
jgi:hypothetical protein